MWNWPLCPRNRLLPHQRCPKWSVFHLLQGELARCSRRKTLQKSPAKAVTLSDSQSVHPIPAASATPIARSTPAPIDRYVHTYLHNAQVPPSTSTAARSDIIHTYVSSDLGGNSRATGHEGEQRADQVEGTGNMGEKQTEGLGNMGEKREIRVWDRVVSQCEREHGHGQRRGRSPTPRNRLSVSDAAVPTAREVSTLRPKPNPDVSSTTAPTQP